MAPFKLDWKFFSTFAVSIFAIAISLYLPRAELTAHELTMTLVSSWELQPPSGPRFQDLQVILDGDKIENPFVSSITITNTGSKPVASADFESPMVLTTEEPARLVTARLAGSTPKGIPVELQIADGKIKILPFLSNPGDEITITLVTSGKPVVKPTARIAGIKEIIVEDFTTPRTKPVAALWAGFVSVGCFCLYTFYMGYGRLLKPAVISPWIRVPTVFFLALFAIQAIQTLTVHLWPLRSYAIIWSCLTMVVGFGVGLVAVRLANKADR
ncbi:hypothetical protein JN403_24630 [Pseudomonas sp. 15A4]|uniref:hypothetical protein n=1 Tax=Pseudomonas sp. 15A4 TaxID=2804761 RepID=UPI001967D0B0|nr:hypothetical protein [Pseudomonas sp. 15A4]QSB19466.1 hypothetical protein JN403_24630 [Pseudomonas sp. 15A4]